MKETPFVEEQFFTGIFPQGLYLRISRKAGKKLEQLKDKFLYLINLIYTMNNNNSDNNNNNNKNKNCTNFEFIV